MAVQESRFKTTCLPGVFVCTDAESTAYDEKCCPVVILAQKTEDGTAEPNTLIEVESYRDVVECAGEASIAACAMQCPMEICPELPYRLLLVDAPEDATAATFTIEILTNAADTGEMEVIIGGRSYFVAIQAPVYDSITNVLIDAGDSKEEIALALADTVNSFSDALWVATVSGAIVTFTAKNRGEIGNGFTVNIPQRSNNPAVQYKTCSEGGVGSPDTTMAIDALGDCCYEAVLTTQCDDRTLRLLEDEFNRRWSCENLQRGRYFFAKCGTMGELIDQVSIYEQAGVGRHGRMVGNCCHTIQPAWQIMVNEVIKGLHFQCVQEEPGPWGGLSSGCSPCDFGCDNSCFDSDEREELLCHGISTLICQDGCFAWERAVSLNLLDDKGRPDEFWKDESVSYKVSCIIEQFRDFASRYVGKVQVVNDGTPIDVGTLTTTASIMKAEFFADIKDQEGRLFEDFDGFKLRSVIYRDTDSIQPRSGGGFLVTPNGNAEKGNPRLINACLVPDLSNNLQRLNLQFKPTLQFRG